LNQRENNYDGLHLVVGNAILDASGADFGRILTTPERVQWVIT